MSIESEKTDQEYKPPKRSKFSSMVAKFRARRRGLIESGHTVEEIEQIRQEDEKKKAEIANQRTQEIERVISRVTDKDWLIDSNIGMGETAFASQLRKLKSENPDVCQEITARIQGKPMIDLGCGVTPYAEIVASAQAGASAFIGVDKYHQGRTPTLETALKKVWRDPERKITEDQLNNFQITIVQEDMLRYLSKLDDNSANIMMNNVDEGIIQTDEYLGKLYKEIVRVVGEDGIFFTKNSVICGRLTQNHTFVPRRKPDPFMGEDLDGLSYREDDSSSSSNEGSQT